MTFVVGDKVRLTNGKRIATVVYMDRYSDMKIKWDHSGKHKYACARDLVKVEEGELNMDTFYEITDPLTGEKHLGKKIGQKSADEWIMEVQGRANPVFLVSKDKVKEVVPYTISVVSLVGDAPAHYETEEGKFSVSEMFLLNKKVVVVSGVDTKAKFNKGKFNPTARILTEKM